MKVKALITLCLTLLAVFSLMSVKTGKATPGTVVLVFDPLTQGNISSAPVGQTFTVDIKVADVVNLVGYEFYLNWSTTLLDFVNVKEGPFLNSSGAYQSLFVAKYPGFPAWPYDDTIYVAGTLLAPQISTSASGTGVLARLTFEVLSEGVCTLDLFSSILARYDPFTPPQIEHTREDGYFALPLPRVLVEPAETLGTLPGQSFNISIDVVDVINVYNWTLKIRWTANLLNATNIYEGSFLSGAGATDFSSSINQDGGIIFINNTLNGAPLAGVSGNGRLATITFKVETRGATDLELLEVRMHKQDGSVSPAATESGSFTNTLRDASITGASVSATSVSKGQKVDITVVVKNNGVQNETFTVRVDFDSQSTGSITVDKLVPEASQTLNFQWDTSNVEPDTYTLKATIVESIPGEVNKSDNTRTIATVTVSGGSAIDLNLLLVAAAVAIVIIVALGLLFLRRRKK